MCGIAGFVGKRDPRALRRSLAALRHRGPDDEGFFEAGDVALGARRLSIIDIEGGAQPVFSQDRRIAAVFNGEIYNFRELAEELKGRGHRFVSKSDTEVIPHAYEEYGEAFLERLEGMFAIALWDARARRLLLARDRLGKKPLYYAHAGRVFIFGSEIKSLLVHPEIRRKLNAEALHHYLSLRHVPSPLSAVQGVHSLRPAARLFFRNGRIEIRRYWNLVFEENRTRSAGETARGILERLQEAVRVRLRADVPLGAYLSGGMDSSSVAGLMAEFLKSPFHTFSLAYRERLVGKDEDERMARKMAEAWKTRHHVHRLGRAEFFSGLRHVARAFDEPFGGVISTYYLSALIRRHVKVALSGDGADELFASYLSHRLASVAGRWKAGKKMKAYFAARYRERDNAVWQRVADGETWRWRSRLVVFDEDAKRRLYSTEFRRRVGQTDTREYFRARFAECTSEDPLNRVLEMEMKNFLPDQVLSFVDRLSMAHSVEVRCPYLDRRLVEYAATIPGEQKIRGGQVKWILKRALQPLLPRDILVRPKEGFVPPVHAWLAMPESRHFLQSCLGAIRKNPLLNPDEVDIVFKRISDEEGRNQIWLLIQFQLFFEAWQE